MNIIETIHAGDLQRVQALVNSNNVNCILQDENGSRPLHIACKKRHLHIVKWLVKLGANVNILTHVRKVTPLHITCRKGCEDIIMFLMQHGAENSLNIQDSLKDTPLHLVRHCSRVNQPTILKMFLEAGANARIKGDMDYIPLHIYHHSIECMRILIDAYPAGVLTHGRRTALQEAAFSRSFEVCELLLNAGSEPIANQSALYWTIFNRNIQLTRLLLDYGVPMLSVSPDSYRWATPEESRHALNMVELALAMISQRRACRTSCLALLQLRRKRAQRICRNGRDILRLVAHHLWACRHDDF